LWRYSKIKTVNTTRKEKVRPENKAMSCPPLKAALELRLLPLELDIKCSPPVQWLQGKTLLNLAFTIGLDYVVMRSRAPLPLSLVKARLKTCAREEFFVKITAYSWGRL